MKILGAQALADTKGISHEEWLQVRRHGIGGSDAAAIARLNPYSSPYLVYLDKTGALPEKEDTEKMRLGRDLEDYVARRFCEETGKKVKHCHYVLAHSRRSYMLANVDRLIVGENAGLECKTTSVLNLKRFKGGEYPEEYYVQCVHYMAVTGAERWYLCVLVLGEGLKTFTIERDEQEIESLIALESAFWNDHVIAKVPPEPIGMDAESDYIAAEFAESNGANVDMSQYGRELERFFDLGQEINELKGVHEALKQKLQLYMGEASKGYSEGYKVSWSRFTQSRLDSKRLQAELPDVYAKYVTQNATQRFTVTPNTNNK